MIGLTKKQSKRGSEMNFSTKAMEEITALIAEEIGNHLDTEEIKRNWQSS